MNARDFVRVAGAAICSLLIVSNASAHSASDAYLTLDAAANDAVSVRGQWDIALRDLDFVLKLDDDGNGEITWAELRRHQPAIARYAQDRLKVTGDGRACAMLWTKQMVANHADGAYAALFFEERCAARPKHLTLDYRLFFDIDPSHRAIVVAHMGAATATAVLAPGNAKIDLTIEPRALPASTPR